MRTNSYFKYFCGLLVLISIAAFFYFELDRFFTIEFLKQSESFLRLQVDDSPVKTAIAFLLIYVLSTALSLPGAAVLTLAAGLLFGLFWGSILASVSSTLGATLSFLISRYLFTNFVNSKFASKIAVFNEGVKRDGALYLFGLRLIPVFPFFLVNIVMGLTPIRLLSYVLVSFVGMLPGTIVYVNAGTQLSQVDSLQGLLSLPVLISFALLAGFPFLMRSVSNWYKKRKVYSKFQKPKKFDYNLVVIGAGAAGLVTSYISAAAQARVALIEKAEMGGDCLNTGCVPSKAIIRSAKLAHDISRAAEFGFEGTGVQPNFSKVMRRVQNKINAIEPHDSVERYQKLGVECFKTEARIVSPFEVSINGKIITTKNIVVATGARPSIPALPGIESVKVLTSNNLWQLDQLPKTLVILGGGAIGCEMAQAFSRLGSKVILIEGSERILSKEDSDVSALIQRQFESEGIALLLRHRALRFAGPNTLVCDFNGNEISIEFDRVLFALGRTPNVSGFGLEELGVKLTANKSIEVDEYLRTSIPNIYACGDVAGPYLFTHMAAHQAWYCAVNSMFAPFKKFKVGYRVVPWATYVDPEVSRVGLSEDEARSRNIAVKVTKYSLEDLDRAIVDSNDKGFVKILTSPGTDKILGAVIVGAKSGEIIAEFVFAMKHRLGLNKILATPHIYPTMSEANKYVAGRWKQDAVSPRLLSFARKFNHWRRT